MVSAKPMRGHWLEGHMAEINEEGIREVLDWDPPNNQQLVILALEESKHLDRSSVYRIFAEYKRGE